VADGRGRLGDELGNRSGRDESPAANDDTGELSSPEKPVDGVPGDATEELSSFLDGVKGAVLHGALGAVKRQTDRMLFGYQSSNDC
jgi:hypothetical protein